MDMEAMNPMRKSGSVDTERHSTRSLPGTDAADRLTVCTDQRHRRAALRLDRGAAGQGQGGRENRGKGDGERKGTAHTQIMR